MLALNHYVYLYTQSCSIVFTHDVSLKLKTVLSNIEHVLMPISRRAWNNCVQVTISDFNNFCVFFNNDNIIFSFIVPDISFSNSTVVNTRIQRQHWDEFGLIYPLSSLKNNSPSFGIPWCWAIYIIDLNLITQTNSINIYMKHICT